jgi:hypothetical protein
MNWKWIAGAAAVAYIFRDQLAATFAPAATQPAETQPAETTWAPALDTASTKARILAAASKDASYNGTLSYDQWNYFYSVVRGVPGPGSQAVGFSTGAIRLTIDEYWAAMTSHGLGRIRSAR